MPENEKLDTLIVKVDTIHEILTGNGDPTKGLVVKVDRIEQKLVPDAGGRLSLLEERQIHNGKARMASLENSRRNQTWLARTAIGAAIAAVIGIFVK
jgi:hypothetical protein